MSEEEFAKNLDQWHRRLFAFAVFRLGNPTDAEDAVQETAFKAFRHCRDFRAESSFATWIFEILRNVIRDVYRKRGRMTFVGLEGLEWLPGGSFSPEERARVLQAVSRLREKQRETLFLWLAGLDCCEIADLHGVPHGTVRAQVSRVNKKVRELLAGEGN